MSIFGLSKLWSWVVVAVTAAALAAGVYLYVFNRGVDHAAAQTAKHNVEVVEKARAADVAATQTIIREFHTIERQGQDVKEVIREVPETGLNPISRARLERVREQQQLAREATSDADSAITNVSSGATSPGN